MSSFCLNISPESPPITGLDMLYITLYMNRENISNYEINPCEYNKIFQKYSTAILAFSMCGFFCDFTQDDDSFTSDDASSAGDNASSSRHRQVIILQYQQITQQNLHESLFNEFHGEILSILLMLLLIVFKTNELREFENTKGGSVIGVGIDFT